jgi:TadE-like protein
MRKLPSRLNNSPNRRHGGALRAFCSFRRDATGASALEFAILVIPVILLLLASLEIGAIYFATFALENATSYGARLLRTGQAQNKKLDAAAFKGEVCKYLTAPLSCSKLKLDVRRFTSFSNAQITEPLDGKGNLKASFTYDPGVGGDVILVRAFYPFDLPAKLPLDVRMSNMSDGNRLLIATVAFRNEPFQVTSTSK